MPARRTFLVTGARAPAALEIIRRLGRAGHDVLAADSLRAPLGRFSRYTRRYFRVPGPRENPAGFIDALRHIAEGEGVDLILPTCEEIYHIGLHREKLTGICDVFCADFDTLLTLHHKERFARFTHQLGHNVVAPESELVENVEQRGRFARESRSWVFKPVYSRSAARTMIRPPAEEVECIALDPANPWLAQRFVAGRELSSYGIAVEGRLVAHALYHSPHRTGQGAGTYFTPAENAAARCFVERLVAHLGFTGQIGFDFIACAATGRVFVLECNPRTTSGIHLFGRDFDLDAALRGSEGLPPKDAREPPQTCMVGAAMLAGGFGHALHPRRLAAWWRDLAAGRDVVFAHDDRLPAFGQAVSLAELAGVGWLRRSDLLAAATADIEWNGSSHTGVPA